MVFANIFSKLNDLEQKVNALSVSNGVSSTSTSTSNDISVDFSPVNEKISDLETVVDTLKIQVSDTKSKVDEFPTDFASPQDVSSLFEKVNQITNILTQFSTQLNKVVERVATLEQKADE